MVQRPDIGRGRKVDPTTSDYQYDANELEFIRAIDQYKTSTGRNFPTYHEILEILISLGYRKVAPAESLPGTK